MDSTSLHPNGLIPANILSMMQERGYSGPENANCYDAMEWLYSEYDAQLEIRPRWATPIEKDYLYEADADSTQLLWTMDARDVTHRMDKDGYCEYYGIRDLYVDSVEYVDPYEIEVLENSYGGFYKTPEEAVFAGVLRLMKLFDEHE